MTDDLCFSEEMLQLSTFFLHGILRAPVGIRGRGSRIRAVIGTEMSLRSEAIRDAAGPVFF